MERQRDEQAAKDGSQVECGCCCCDLAIENAVQCTDGHLFCRTCLLRYVEESVFGTGKAVVTCMSTSEACDGFFAESMLRKSLPDKVMRAYDDAIAKLSLKGAAIANLVTCRACQMQVEMPEEAGSVLVCSSCGVDTCRHCGEESHVPLRCSEVEKKSKSCCCCLA